MSREAARRHSRLRANGALFPSSRPRASRPLGHTICSLARLLAAGVLLVLATGCSTVQIAYNHADQIVAWMADDYLNLNREQEAGMQPLLERFHAWHRRTQLPDYARLLEAIDERLERPIVPADVDWLLGALRSRYEVMARRAHPDIARLLATLSDAQIASLERKLEESNRAWMQERGAALPISEQKRLRTEHLLEGIERWTGALRAEQRARLAALSDEIPLVTGSHLRYRIRRQREFLALLALRDDAAQLERGLRAWLLDWDRGRAPEYEGMYEAFAAARSHFYAEALQLLDAEQHRQLTRRLRSLSETLRELAEQQPRHSDLALLR